MKHTTFTLLAGLAFATSAFAGHEMSTGKDSKYVVEPCFHDRELQIDLFGTYNAANYRGHYSFDGDNDADDVSPYKDGFGGGVAVNYFFIRYLGVGIEGNVFDGGHKRTTEGAGDSGDVGRAAVWNLGGRLIARYPLELGGTCISPYLFAGGGVQFDGGVPGTWLVGGGLEWRATPMFGVFSEGRYTWAANHDDSSQARVGVRFVF